MYVVELVLTPCPNLRNRLSSRRSLRSPPAITFRGGHEANRLDAAAQLVTLFLSLVDADDACLMAQSATERHLRHAASPPTPIEDRAFAGSANDEAQMLVQQRSSSF